MTEWNSDMSAAPRDGEFLAYGSYLYEGDTFPTTYIQIVERSGDEKWPWATSEGNAALEAFSHWMALPKPPTE